MIVLGHDPKAKTRDVELKLSSLLRHVAIVGSSGSGKTVTCKVLCEEFALRGIPVIAVDPQGDIASLALAGDPDDIASHGGDPERVQRWRDEVEVVVWTPVSSAGIPISVNPLNFNLDDSQSEAERIRAISFVAQNISQLLGYDTAKRDGRSVMALLDLVLTYAINTGWELGTLDKLADAIKSMPDTLSERAEDLIAPRLLNEVVRQLRTLTVGARKLLFAHGAPLDIDLLLGREASGAPPPFVPQPQAAPGDETQTEATANSHDQGSPPTAERKRKTRVSVIYLNTLSTQEEKAFFLAELTSALYRWMLANPSTEPQAAFYIDEIAPFLPPTRKPASRDILRLLFKQARKYGVACLMATQNPGDVDYKSLAQFATVLLGRLTTKQDIEKVQHLIESLVPSGADGVLAALPRLKAGKFRVVSPDNFAEPQPLQVRWLLTQHRTLDEDGLDEVVDIELRKRLTKAGQAAARREQERQRTSSRVHTARFRNEAEAAEDAVRHAVQAARQGLVLDGDDDNEPAAAALPSAQPAWEDAADSALLLTAAELVEQPAPEPVPTMDVDVNADADVEVEPAEDGDSRRRRERSRGRDRARNRGRDGSTGRAGDASSDKANDDHEVSEARTVSRRVLGVSDIGAVDQLTPLTAAAPAQPDAAMDPANAALAEEYGLTERQLEVFALLRERPALLTQDEIADKFPYSKATIARDVRALEDTGLVCRLREGNRHAFHAAEHRRTAYGFLAELSIAKLCISEARAHEVGNRAVPGSLFGRSGEVVDTTLRYFPLWRCSFVGQRTKRLLGLLRWGSERVEESVYMHPTEDKIAVLTSSGFRFQQAPPQNPADLEDLDGHVEWESGHAEPLDLFEELAPRLLAPEAVARHFEQKFLDHKVGRPDKTELVFIPVWKALWQSYRTDARKTLHIDGIRGHLFEF